MKCMTISSIFQPQPLFEHLALVPLFALVAREIGDNASTGTAFALYMAVIRRGRNVGGYFGMGLLAVLGGVEPPLFENLRMLVLVRSLTRALPLLLIRLLLPPGTPMDPKTESLCKHVPDTIPPSQNSDGPGHMLTHVLSDASITSLEPDVSSPNASRIFIAS